MQSLTNKEIFTIDWANPTNILFHFGMQFLHMKEFGTSKKIVGSRNQYNLHTYIRTWYKSKILHTQDLSTRKKMPAMYVGISMKCM
jgi:hypothetical protein